MSLGPRKRLALVCSTGVDLAAYGARSVSRAREGTDKRRDRLDVRGVEGGALAARSRSARSRRRRAVEAHLRVCGVVGPASGEARVECSGSQLLRAPLRHLEIG